MADLETELLRTNPASWAEPLLPIALSLCRWEAAPTGWCGGRAGWHRLSDDLADATGVAALKLKGLGQAPTPGAPAQPPSDELYDRWPGADPDPHFGIDEEGEFCLKDGDAAPVGGLFRAGAEREFDCAAAMAEHDVPSVAPVAVVAYRQRAHTRSDCAPELAVSVTASTVASTHRCAALLTPPERASRDAELSAAIADIAVRVGYAENLHSAAARLHLLAACYHAFGATLRGFAAAGWYRYSGHPDNFVIGDAGEAILVDLDSCRPATGRSPHLAAMEEIRDGMSALYNLACSFFRPHVMDWLTDQDLIDNEPFSALLDGWDPGSAGANARAGQVLARYVIAARNRLRRFEPFLRSPLPAADHLYRYVRHDRDLTFSLLYRELWLRRWARPHLRALPFGPDELDQRLLRFAGRYRYDQLRVLATELEQAG